MNVEDSSEALSRNLGSRFERAWHTIVVDLLLPYAVTKAVEIVYNNIRHKPSGRKVNGPWVFAADPSLPDGIAHPASPEFRSHQGPGGDFSYHFREVLEDLRKRFQVEFFFMAPSQDTRGSVLAYYDERGDATWAICNRENVWDPQEKPSTWSSSNATARERVPPPGPLTGVEYTLTADLVLSEAAGATWRGYERPVGRAVDGEDCLAANEYKLLQMPDGLSICLPRRVRRGTGAFQVSMHWQMDARTVPQETVVYGADGAFESFRTAHYTV
ncbi:hypothetical protein KFL_000330280 [Klebsormidium nitens]|uniref:Uncharacterized protein n=1 Tax=Klebsormidium nitens TaxID=105231 RepID=A0A1Y1HRG2_KLENI|nr:hypothetical protein KFL_000330280 [Klebsormidium nitens]|eukprot:GAQ79581.1 hypothetical protein KFL_000330280 [Klebsormidium nitens]